MKDDYTTNSHFLAFTEHPSLKGWEHVHFELVVGVNLGLIKLVGRMYSTLILNLGVAHVDPFRDSVNKSGVSLHTLPTKAPAMAISGERAKITRVSFHPYAKPMAKPPNTIARDCTNNAIL